MSIHDFSTNKVRFISWNWIQPETYIPAETMPVKAQHPKPFIALQPLRRWLEQVNVRDLQRAHLICKLIPSHCPFERDVKWGGKTLFHIPALCQINPLYEDIIALRFRALCYLADECGEDVTQYC